MGCGASNTGGGPTARYEDAAPPPGAADRWTSDGAPSVDDAGSRASSGGAPASESPLALRVRKQVTVISSFLLHGIRGDVDQFQAPAEPFSSAQHRKVEEWVDEGLQFALRHLAAPPLAGTVGGRMVDDAAPPDAFAPSSVPVPQLGLFFDIPLLAHVMSLCAGNPALPLLQRPLSCAALSEDQLRKQLITDLPRSPVSLAIALGSGSGSENNMLSPHSSSRTLQSTRSFAERPPTFDNLKHHNRAWSKISAMYRERSRAAADDAPAGGAASGAAKAQRPVMTLQMALFDELLTQVEPRRLEELRESLIDTLKSPGPNNLSSPTSPERVVPSQHRSRSTSTVTQGNSAAALVDAEKGPVAAASE